MHGRNRTKRFWRPSAVVTAGSLVLAMAGCVSAPPQTVELAEVTLDQINSIEKSHRDLVRAYFGILEARVNDFIDNRWVPDFLNRAVRNEEVQRLLEETRLGLDIDTEALKQVLVRSREFNESEAQIVINALDVAQIDYRVRFSNVMLEFSQAAMLEINRVREQWRSRLRARESEFMSELDQSYGTLRSGHLQIRAYLDSAVEVRALQDEVLNKLGVLEERDRVLEEIISSTGGFASGTDSLNEVIDTLESAGIGEDEPAPLDADLMEGILEDLDSTDNATEQ